MQHKQQQMEQLLLHRNRHHKRMTAIVELERVVTVAALHVGVQFGVVAIVLTESLDELSASVMISALPLTHLPLELLKGTLPSIKTDSLPRISATRKAETINSGDMVIISSS